MAAMYFWFFFVIPLAVLASEDADTSLLIKTSSGLVRGKIVTGYTNKEARAFYGIPYAEIPVGKLRFKPPLPVTPWTGEFDATQTALPCYQQYTKESLKLNKKLGTVIRRPWSEDCLTLSIWTPTLSSHEVPVEIIFHSGGFTTGTGVYPHIDCSTFSVEADLVQITVNYRLGAFGFLSLGTSEFPGNLGLMDQHLALKWIHDNVDKFGGKQKAIFLLGQGAGAVSIGHQIILSKNRGLFKTAIILDGSPTCSWTWQTKENATVKARHLSRGLGYSNSNTSAEIECLQNAHPEDILQSDFFESDPNMESWRPNVDGDFIKELPSKAVKAGRLNNVTIVYVSSAQGESVKFMNINEDILSEPGPGLTEEGFQEAVRRARLVNSDSEGVAITDFYLKKDCPMNSTEIRDAAIHACSDGLYTCCSTEFLNDATKIGILVFKYVFDIPDSRFPPWIGAHNRIFMSVHTGETLNPKYGYGVTERKRTMDVIRSSKVLTRTK